MKKLLIIGSGAIHTYNYINLVKGYFDDILLLTNKRRDGYDIDIVELDFHVRPSMIGTVIEIKRIADQYCPSVVHIHQANSYAFLPLIALRNNSVPKVLTAWGSDILLFPKINYLYKRMAQYVLEKVDVITSDSLYMANEIKSLCHVQPDIVLVSYGVGITAVKKGKENIVFSNRMHKGLYNIDKVLAAFHRFVQDNPNWKLVIAGAGKEAETRSLMDLARKLGIDENVEFTGWLDAQQNLNYYNVSKIYISVPDSDATSISLLEAISNNCICFVSNLPANCEHVLDHINGFIENDLTNIDLNKHRTIDVQLLLKVNAVRSQYYSDQYCRNLFTDIYDRMLAK